MAEVRPAKVLLYRTVEIRRIADEHGRREATAHGAKRIPEAVTQSCPQLSRQTGDFHRHRGGWALDCQHGDDPKRQKTASEMKLATLSIRARIQRATRPLETATHGHQVTHGDGSISRQLQRDGRSISAGRKTGRPVSAFPLRLIQDFQLMDFGVLRSDPGCCILGHDNPECDAGKAQNERQPEAEPFAACG